ncbi:hypothetical protein VP01_2820g2, partial [Puccinia sorghi]
MVLGNEGFLSCLYERMSQCLSEKTCNQPAGLMPYSIKNPFHHLRITGIIPYKASKEYSYIYHRYHQLLVALPISFQLFWPVLLVQRNGSSPSIVQLWFGCHGNQHCAQAADVSAAPAACGFLAGIRWGNTTQQSHIYLHFKYFQFLTSLYHHHHLNIYFSNNIGVFHKLLNCGHHILYGFRFQEGTLWLPKMQTQQKHWREAARNGGKSLPKALVDMTLEEFPSLLDTGKKACLRSDTTLSSCSSDNHEYKPISITRRMYSSYACQFEGNDLNVDSSVLLDYVMIFVAWLYLVCGISQARC